MTTDDRTNYYFNEVGLDEIEVQCLKTPLRILLGEFHQDNKEPFLTAIRAKDRIGEYNKSQKTSEWRNSLRGSHNFTKETSIETAPTR